MGGYGSFKFGVKYPEMFVLAGSFSGASELRELQIKIADAGFKIHYERLR